MSERNVEIIRAGYEAFGRGDLTAMFGALDPQVVSCTAPPLPDPGEHTGLEGMMTWIGGWTEEFGEFSLVAEEFVDRGEFVLARIRQVATGASSGIPIEREFWLLHQLPRRPHRPRRRAPLARARRERCGPAPPAAFDLAGAVGDRADPPRPDGGAAEQPDRRGLVGRRDHADEPAAHVEDLVHLGVGDLAELADQLEHGRHRQRLVDRVADRRARGAGGC